MARIPLRVDDFRDGVFDEIIDVRTPAEFAIDHLPGAINLPVLSDDERILVGTLYKQTSAFEAKKLGASLVAKNISSHLDSYFKTKEQRYKPLIYCWRGGQRSESLALVLAQIGWDVTLLKGGYKRFRRTVFEALEALPRQFCYRVVCGLTGTGKTEVLRSLRDMGEQVLDLEGMAKHRGSLLGVDPSQAQPSQKAFDTALYCALQSFSKDKVVWVESESNKIGNVQVPPAIWLSLRSAPRVEVEAPIEARVAYLLKEYVHFIENPGELKEKLKVLLPFYGREVLARWYGFVEAEMWSELVRDLLITHYDPCYRRALAKNYTGEVQVVHSLQVPPKDFSVYFKRNKQ